MERELNEVRIYNNKHKTWTYRNELKKMGFVFESNYWKKECQYDELYKIKKFCKKKGLEYAPINKKYARNSTYRSDFFRENKGIFKTGEIYHCAYCGRLKFRKNITVDHLIPINKVLHGEKKKYWRFYLELKGVDDVNSVKNLVPACKRCNTKKGTKTGLWLIRGIIGKNAKFWILYKPIKLIILFIIAWNIYIRLDPTVISNLLKIVNFNVI